MFSTEIVYQDPDQDQDQVCYNSFKFLELHTPAHLGARVMASDDVIAKVQSLCSSVVHLCI